VVPPFFRVWREAAVPVSHVREVVLDAPQWSCGKRERRATVVTIGAAGGNGDEAMGKRRRWGPAVPVVLLGLAGCAAVDSFSSRAMTYNQQAETIKESQLMLNVMRSAYREPLQFTDFTQVTGQATVSGTAAFTLPFNPSPPTFGHADTALPAATLSGTQAFTVANLDTQEFYEGILSPIPITSIDYYLEQGFPEALLLTLVISRVDIESGKNSRVSFYNVPSGKDFLNFEGLVAAFRDLGVRSEVARTLTNVGPPIPAGDIASLRALAPLAEGAVLKRFTPASDPDLTPSERADLARRGVSEYFRLQQTSEQSRFCIDTNAETPADLSAASGMLVGLGVLPVGDQIEGLPTTPASAALDDAAARCGASPYVRMKAAEQNGYTQPTSRFALAVLTAGGAHETVTLRIDLTVRSVEGIIYYLGELARGELDIGGGGMGSAPIVQTGAGSSQVLFRVRQNCTGLGAEIDAVYDGSRYCVSIDPSGADRSSQVMEIVLQLLALNTSAKTLPAPSVITVLGQ